MSESPAVQATQPVLNQNGRICLSFDVIDEPSITYLDAVRALSLECSPVLLPPPHWGHKSLSGIFSGWLRTTAKTSTQDRAALDSQASLASAILKLKFSDFIAVHRRILATIWRLFCKWNSSAAVCALQNARRQAYSAATPDGRSTETDSSCAAASSSPVFASPADGSPQVNIVDSMHPLRYGPHWSVLGFQSDDPVSDLRGSGMLGLLQLLWLLSSEDALPGWCVINRSWREQRGAEVDSFPLAIVSINFTCISFDAFARGKLAVQIESAHSSGTELSALQCINTFYGGCFVCMASTWSKQHLTIENFSQVSEHIKHIVSKTPTKIFKIWLSVEPATSSMLSPLSPASPESILRFELA